MHFNSPFQSYQWTSNIFGCQSNDIDKFYALLLEEVSRLKLNEVPLGTVDSFPLSLYQSPSYKADYPSLLISTGFHGEEAAGPWGMLHFLRQIDAELFERVNLNLLPLVNPTGFSHGNRLNKQGDNPNRGFILENGQSKSNDQTSLEGKLLLANSDLLQAASRDGILTCHEDVLLDDAYIYSFEAGTNPSSFSIEMRDTLGRYFTIATDGVIDDCPVRDGIIFNHFDYSFEAFLMRSGSSIGVCSETPGQQDFDQRVLANSALMDTFIHQRLQSSLTAKP
jgi:predicted deacylase